MFLFSLATVVEPAPLNPNELTAKDRKRLRAAIAPILADPIHPARGYATNFGDAAALVDELLDQ